MEQLILELAARVAALERRADCAQRPGKVEQVDLANKLVRISIGEADPDDDSGQPFMSPWVPYAQHAGALRLHNPPSVGQQMHLLSPSGDFEQGVAIPFGWSDETASPGDGAEPVLTFGQVRAVLTETGLTITAGDASLVVDAAGVSLAFGGQSLALSDALALLKGARLETSGPLHFNGGARPVAFKGAHDSRGDMLIEGADGVFI